MDKLSTFEGTISVIAGILLGLPLLFLAPKLADLKPLYFLALIIAVPLLVLTLFFKVRKEIFLGFFSFAISLAAVDKWLLQSPHHFGGAAGVQISLPDLILLVLYGIWLTEILFSRRKDRLDKKIIFRGVIPALMFIFLSALSVLNAPDIKLLGFEVIQMLKMLLWFYYLINNIDTEKELRIVVLGLIFSVVVHILFAFIEKLTGSSLGLGALGEVKNLVLEPVGGRMMSRIGGIMPHPIALGSFLALTLPFIIGVVLSENKRLITTMAVIALVAGFPALILTLARGAMVGWAVGLIIMLFLVFRQNLARKRVKVIIVVSMVVLIMAVLLSPIWYSRFTASRASNVGARYLLIEVAFNMIKSHPVIGIGLNNFSKVILKYDTNGISRIFTDPVHNIFLLVLSETGIITFVAFLWFLSVPFRAGISGYRRRNNLFLTMMSAAGLTSLIVYLLVGQASWEFRISPLTQIFWFICGFLIVTDNIGRKQNAQPAVTQKLS